jgi:hypothetical protein
MSREDEIQYRKYEIQECFIDSDRIWPLNIKGFNSRGLFVSALKEVLLRLPDDQYYHIEESVMFALQHPKFRAVNVPNISPPSTDPTSVGSVTIVFFSLALSLPHEPLVGLIAHELAHCFTNEPDYEKDEKAADALAFSWGFKTHIAKLRGQSEV